MERPLLSIVTIAKNDLAGLKLTRKSLEKQNARADIEHIVIDGGSTDGSLEWLIENRHIFTLVDSGQDRGISDGFNRGIKLARGEWIQLLNAGDEYATPRSLEQILRELRASSHKIVTGFAEAGRVTIPKKILKTEDPLPTRVWLSHQASFVRRELYERFGTYDLQLKLRMDLDFWYRALANESFAFIPEVLVRYRPGGIAQRAFHRFHIEELRILGRYLSGGTRVVAQTKTILRWSILFLIESLLRKLRRQA